MHELHGKEREQSGQEREQHGQEREQSEQGSDQSEEESEQSEEEGEQSGRRKQYSYRRRLESFDEWPVDNPISPLVLAEAGFFWTGENDEVVCVVCKTMLYCLEAGDDPWVVHASRYPPCKFVTKKKGSAFVANHQVTGSGTKRPLKLKALLKYCCVARIRFDYGELVKGCVTYKDRTDKLVALLHEAGIEGVPNMVKAKAIQAKRKPEEEEQRRQKTERCEQEGERNGQEREQRRQESEQSGQEREQGHEGEQCGQEREQRGHEREQRGQERGWREQQSEQSWQERDQSGQEREQCRTKREQSRQEREQRGYEREQSGQENEQRGQDSEQSRKETEQRERKRELSRQEGEQRGQESENSRSGQDREQRGDVSEHSRSGQDREQRGDVSEHSRSGQYREQHGEYSGHSRSGQDREQRGEESGHSRSGQDREQRGEYSGHSRSGQDREQRGEESGHSRSGQDREQRGEYSGHSRSGQDREQRWHKRQQRGQEIKQSGRKNPPNRRSTVQFKKSPGPKRPKPNGCGVQNDDSILHDIVTLARNCSEATRGSLLNLIAHLPHGSANLQKRPANQTKTPAKKAKLSCDECSKSYTNKYFLEKHLSQHGLSCEECGELFKAQSGLSKHRKTCGKSASVKKSGFNCALCNKCYSSEIFLVNHIKEQHENDQNVLVCDNCGANFSFLSSLMEHQRKCGNEAHQNGVAKTAPQQWCSEKGGYKANGEASPRKVDTVEQTAAHRGGHPSERKTYQNCKLCFSEGPFDLEKHYAIVHKVPDPSSMLCNNQTFLVPKVNKRLGDDWFCSQLAKAMERYTDTVCRLCEKKDDTDLAAHYVGYHKVERDLLYYTKRLLRNDDVSIFTPIPPAFLNK